MFGCKQYVTIYTVTVTKTTVNLQMDTKDEVVWGLNYKT